MAIILERAAHSVVLFTGCLSNHMLLVVSRFSFEGLTVVLIAPVPGHCFPFTLNVHL